MVDVRGHARAVEQEPDRPVAGCRRDDRKGPATGHRGSRSSALPSASSFSFYSQGSDSPPARLPYVIVRFACRDCPRVGQYRLAVLAERFGAEALLIDGLEANSAGCLRNRERHPNRRCQAYLPDLVDPKPPDLPAAEGRRFKVIVGGKASAKVPPVRRASMEAAVGPPRRLGARRLGAFLQQVQGSTDSWTGLRIPFRRHRFPFTRRCDRCSTGCNFSTDRTTSFVKCGPTPEAPEPRYSTAA